MTTRHSPPIPYRSIPFQHSASTFAEQLWKSPTKEEDPKPKLKEAAANEQSNINVSPSIAYSFMYQHLL